MLAWRHLMLILFTLSLAGCVTHRDLARNAVSFNLAVEQAQNEMLLLNTVRSSLRRPMYITGIQSVTGSLSTQVSAGLSIPIGKKSETNLSTMGGNYTDHPTFNVAVFETEEFMRGFTAPIAPELLAYYWDQGWSAAFLLHLLVEHVRVTWVAADPSGNKMVPTACIKGSIEPIFVARQSAADCRGGALETDYGGRPYFVPERIRGSREQCTPPGAPPGDLKPDLYRPALQGCDGGRSMQALSLASQIISLQKSAKDLPAPSVLRTIN